MGEMVEMMLEGILCEGCGALIDGEAPGHPRYCSKACGPISLQRALKSPLTPNARKAERHKQAEKRFGCDCCPKLFRTAEGRDHHKRIKHADHAL